MKGYFKKVNESKEPLIIEPEDWTKEEFKTLCKLFDCPEGTERIKVTFEAIEGYCEGKI